MEVFSETSEISSETSDVHVIQCGYPHLRPFTDKLIALGGLICVRLLYGSF